MIRVGTGKLDRSIGVYQCGVYGTPGNRKVFDSTNSVDAIQGIRGNFTFTEQVFFCAIVCHCLVVFRGIRPPAIRGTFYQINLEIDIVITILFDTLEPTHHHILRITIR